MGLPKIYTHNIRPGVHGASRGFTLVEMLIIVGIIMMFVGVSLFVDMNQFRGNAFRAEQDTILTLMQTARANAMNNIDQQAHGIAFYPADHSGSYVLFEGTSYATSDSSTQTVVDSQYPVVFSADSPAEVVFSQLSGNANYNGDITLNDPERGLKLLISVNQEGRISW